MFETLKLIFFAAAILFGLLFLLARKKGTGKSSRLLLIALALAALGGVTILVNNIRMNGNIQALKSSPVVTRALEVSSSVLISDNSLTAIRENSKGQKIQEPYVLVPVDCVHNWRNRSEDHYEIASGDSCWSGGQFVSADQANQCKTILFYDTFVLEMPYQSSSGRKTTGRSESKTVYLYDVETESLFDYKVFDTNLPTITRGTPNMRVSTQTILDWAKEELSR